LRPEPTVQEIPDSYKRTVGFGGRHTEAMKMLPIAFIMTGFGGFMLYVEYAQGYGRDTLPAWGVFSIGLFLLIAALTVLGRANRKSLLLSPLGIKYYHAGDAIIPWSEILSVDRMDAVFRAGRSRDVTKDAVALTVSRQFFDTVFDKGGPLLSPKYANAGHFLIDGDTVQIPIFHDMLGVSGDVIHGAVINRWRLFGRKEDVEKRDARPVLNVPQSLTEKLGHWLGREFIALLGGKAVATAGGDGNNRRCRLTRQHHASRQRGYANMVADSRCRQWSFSFPD
jgi:hypothetical protein